MLCHIVTLVLNFSVRRYFILTLGIELLGYDSLFVDLMGLLNMAELGMGTALAINLYKPIAQGDKNSICAIMNLLRRVYFFVGCIVAILGTIMLINIQTFVNKPIADIGYIRIVFGLYLINAVIGYAFSAQKVYLSARQKMYVLSLSAMLLNIISAVIRLAVLVYLNDFILYILVKFIFLNIGNLYIYHYLKKNDEFLFMNKKVQLSSSEMADTKNNMFRLVFQRFSSTIISYTDNLVISSFIGISIIGFFSNYKLLIDSINGIISQILSAISVGMGSYSAEKSPLETNNMLNNLTFFCFVIANFCSVSLIVLVNPFITLWLGSGYLLNITPVIIAIANFYIITCVTSIYDIYTFSGSYKQDMKTPIIEATANIVFSILLVNLFGISGVLIGTTICYIIGTVRRGKKVFKYYFKKSPNDYFVRLLQYVGVTIAAILSTYFLGQLIQINNIYIALLVKACICIIIPNSLVLLIYGKSSEFIYFKTLIINIMNKVRLKS